MIDTSVIPQTLIDHDQWVCWRTERRNGKPTKVPYNPRTEAMASTTNPDTWSSFNRCQQATGYEGVGFVFTQDDPFVGIDLDDCIDDAGQLSPESQAIVDAMGSYAEISPSGRGIKIFGVGSRPGSRSKTTRVAGMSAVEVYDAGRYFTVTALKLHVAPLEVQDVQARLDEFYRQWFPPDVSHAKDNNGTPLDDDQILDLIGKSRQSEKFARLWSGDSSAYGDDVSAGDMALCMCLAFWTRNDPAAIDRMFRQSGRMRDKWDARRGERTYGEITVASAVTGNTEVYESSRRDDYDWFASSQRVSPCDELRERIDQTIAGKLRALPWRWRTIGRLTKALMPGTVTILCGNPGATKSFFILESLAWWCAQRLPVRCLMLEGSRAYHLQRAIAQKARDARLADTDWIEANPDQAKHALEQSKAFLSALGHCLAVPPSDVCPTSDQVATWVENECATGSRIVCVDPITLATPGEKQWTQDHELIARSKKAAESSGASILLVTHPKKHPQGLHLDDVSGGAAVTRFADTALWLQFVDKPEPKKCVSRDQWGLTNERYIACDRIIRVLKARNGPGTGQWIGMTFERESLTFTDHGVIERH